MSAPVRKRKSFGTRPAEGAPVGAPPIELEIFGEVFKVRGQMSGVYLMHIIRSIEGNSEAQAISAMYKFLEDVFLKENREEAMEFLRTSEPVVDMEMLQDIIYYLIGEYTGNPIEPSPSSTSGSDDTGSGSTVEPSVTESISSLPTSTESDTQPSSPVSSQRAS